MVQRAIERVGPVKGAAQEEWPAVQHSVREVKMGDGGIHNAREMDSGVGGGCGSRRLFISKMVSKASQGSVEQIRVDRKGEMSCTIPGGVEIALGVGRVQA